MRAKEGTPVATSVAFILWQKFVAIPKTGGVGEREKRLEIRVKIERMNCRAESEFLIHILTFLSMI